MASCALLPCLTAGGAAAGPAFSIAEQPLGAALLELARQSGRDVLFRPELVRGCRAAPLTGISDFETALSRLIGGCHLRYRLGDGGAIELERAPPPSVATVGGPLPEVLIVSAPYRGVPPTAIATTGLIDSLTTDDLRERADRTLAESLGRLAGVNVLVTSLQGDLGGIDRAARGEGQFAAVRGLDSAYAVTRLDGVSVAQSMPYSRAVQLSLLPPLAMDGVELTKTPDARDDGDATAGQFDLRLASALEGGAHTRLLLQGNLDERSATLGRSSGGGLATVDIARQLGRDNSLGLAVTGYYGRNRFASVEQSYQSTQFEYRLTDANGRTPAGMDPARNLLATSLNVQYSEGETRRWGGSLAGDWQPNDTFRAFAHVTVATADTDQEVYQMGFQGGRDPSFITRVALGNGLYETRSVKTQVHYWFETNPDTATLGTAQVGADWHAGALTLSPRLFYTWGENGRPQHIEMSFWNPATTTVAQGLTLGHQNGYPVVTGPAAALALADGVDGLPVSNRGQITSLSSRQDRLGGALDGKLAIAPDATLEAGVKITDSQRDSYRRDQEGQLVGGRGAVDAGITLADLSAVGLRAGTLTAPLAGIYDFTFPLVDADRLAQLYRQRDTTARWTADAWNGNTLSGGERTVAAYAQTRLAWDELELLPGFRAEFSDLTNRYWLSGNNGLPAGGVNYGWNDSTSQFTALLPRMLARWRPDDHATYRAAIWTSQTAPSPYQLAGNATATQDSDGVVTLTRGNPDLKAVDGLNFDLSGAWTWPGTEAGDDGRLELALFHKRLKNYLYDAGGSLATGAATSDAQVRLSIPTNGGTARLTGAELTLDQGLAPLADSLRHFRLAGTLSWETTSVCLNNADLDAVERVQYAPRWLAGVQLRYDRDAIHLALDYRWADDYVQSYGTAFVSGGGTTMAGSALDTWVHPTRRLDLSAGYDVGSGLSARLTVRNLGDALAYRTSVGRHGDAVVQTISAGRSYQLSLQQAL
ncbi:TonB-dependent receptor [Nitrospirillum iridis]|uniref:TonB-dependent receptor n=1 Tax=Nitrospirillum iridis TaxID=765888 RepID=A0A7X0AVA3_9PROT|nr:TonB-dependent receptor [Nitrospirillum iridis]MBB6250748.1 TonB-dependent receptor [Nitrospirillum iridis]